MIKKGLLLMSLFSASAISSQNKEFSENVFKYPSFNKNNIEILTEFNIYTDHSSKGYFDLDGVAQNYNEDNDLRSIAIKSDTITLGISRFHNSYLEMSNMFSLEHDIMSFKSFDIQLGLALVSGYDKDLIKKGFFINETLLVPLLSFKYSPDFLEYKSFQLSPKIRVMGFEAYMVNLELSYKL